MVDHHQHQLSCSCVSLFTIQPSVKVGDPKGAIHVSHGGPAGSTDAADLPRARKSAEPTYYHDYLGLVQSLDRDRSPT